ncbi:MAG: AsmA family protein [Pseudomonadota bacterium]
MKKFLIGVLVLIVMLAAVVALVPMLVPASTYKPQIEAAAKNAIGRDVSFSDELSFSIFPRAGFTVKELEIANAEGFDGAYLARIDEATIGVRIMPLLSRSIEIERFILRRPSLNLQVAKDGAVNWNLAGAEATSGDGASAGDQVGDLSLGDVRIEDGKAVFANAATGQRFEASAMNLKARLEKLSAPLTLDGDLVFQGAPSTASLVLTTLDAVMKGEEADLKLDLTLADAAVGADLKVTSGETLSYSGPLSIDAPDLPALAALMDVALEEAPGFDRLKITGDVEGGETSARLALDVLQFDKISADGAITLDWGGARPKASGAISTPLLDLRPYMPPPAATEGGFPAWSEAKIDFSSLRNLDADLSVAASRVMLNDLNIGSSQMKLSIVNGRMVADIPKMALYGGEGSGQLVVNARSAAPSFAGEFDLGAVKAEAFSADFLKTDRLLGLGSLTLKFTASGASQAAIMRTLDGDGGFDLNDGAIKGINIAKLARAAASLQQGFDPAALTSAISSARGPDEATDFTNFLSAFRMDNGVVSARTISMSGPFLKMTGSGSVNLPNQTIDLRLSPRATSTADGQGGRAIAVPMRVTGTFAQPKVSVDAEALVGDRVRSGVRDLIGGALGGARDGGAKDGAQSGDQKEPSAAQSILRGVLGGGSSGGGEGGGQEGAKDEGAASAQSPEEAIANEVINSIFGAPRQSGGEEDAPADDKDNPNR